jgi:ribonuclease P/MRP protein subunit POP5
MTTRPPTLREKRRYLFVRLEPAGTVIDPKDLYYAVSEAITSLFGDSVAAIINQAVVATESPYVIIRCRRGTERELSIALSTITGCRDARFALRIVAASGTMESLRERMKTKKILVAAGPGPAECIFAGRMYQVSYCDGQKIDVIEKGFKNTHRLFLTREDMEES